MDVFQEQQCGLPYHLQQLFHSSTIHSRKRNYIAPLSQRDFHRHQLLRVHWVEFLRELSRRKQITLVLKIISNIYQHCYLTTCPPSSQHSHLVWRMTFVEQEPCTYSSALTPPLDKPSGRDTSPWIRNSPYRGPGNRVGFSDFILADPKPEGSMQQEYRLADKSHTYPVMVYNHQHPQALI